MWKWYQPEKGKVVALEELSDMERINVNFIKQIMEDRENHR